MSILRGKENRRTRQKTLESREKTTTTLYSHKFQVRELTLGYTHAGCHPSSYKPVRPGLTWRSEVKGNALTASATRAPLNRDLTIYDGNLNGDGG